MFSLRSLFGGAKACAVDFEDDRLLLVEAAMRGTLVTPRAISSVTLLSGLLENGIILDQKATSDALHLAYQKGSPHPFTTKDVIAELPDVHIFMRHLTIPIPADEKALEADVLAQARLSIPIELEENAWDFQVLAKNETSYEILFAAAPAEIVRMYEETVALAGLRLVALEPESISIARAVIRAEDLGARKGVVLLDLGGRGSTISFVDAGGIRLTISRPEGGRMITEALMKKGKLMEEKAEKKKRDKGMEDPQVATVVQMVLAPLIEEFQKAKSFYEQTTQNTVEKILCIGGTGRLTGILPFLTETLACPVESGAPRLSITIDGLEPERSASVIGLAMRAARLLPGLSFIVPD